MLTTKDLTDHLNNLRAEQQSRLKQLQENIDKESKKANYLTDRMDTITFIINVLLHNFQLFKTNCIKRNSRKFKEQAGAELWQAQHSLSLDLDTI